MAVPAHGLSGTDLQSIRDSLTAGRRPKVVFTRSAGQIEGQLGQVVRLDDPKTGDDWIVVRFGRDELPFSPLDVAIPPKATPAKRTGAKPVVDAKIVPATGGGAAKTVGLTADNTPADNPTVAKSLGGKQSRASKTSPASAHLVPAPREEHIVPASSAVNPPTPATAAAPAPEKRPAKAAKAKTPPSLTVTVAYHDREWTVAAQQGTKALAKPYVIRPAEAMRMVSLLDVPAVHEAVEHIITAERAEAQGQADRLRAELAEIEARLSELTDEA